MKKSHKAALFFLSLTLCFSLGSRGSNTIAATTTTPAAAGGTDILLLTCMDYRLTDDTAKYMQQTRGLNEKYDQLILAGASLGATNTKFPDWGKTFWQHLQVAIDLHHIHKVMIIDHRDCGAYRVILNEGSEDRARETKVHTEQLTNLKKMITAKYPT